MLSRWCMDATEDGLSWTIPMHVIMWTMIGLVLLMGVVVLLMR
jgi:hypothetical protein